VRDSARSRAAASATARSASRLGILSVLVRLQDRRRVALVAGTFVIVIGAVYYAFMAAWLDVFLVVGLSNTLRIGLALTIGAINVKDFVAPPRGVSLAIPARARPALVVRMHRLRQARALPALLAAVAALAVAVNLIESLRTAGLPAMYTAVLAQPGCRQRRTMPTWVCTSWATSPTTA
jgi:hypothetical protein